jgi:hypothetical protein
VPNPTVAAGHSKALLDFAVSRGTDRQLLIERSHEQIGNIGFLLSYYSLSTEPYFGLISHQVGALFALRRLIFVASQLDRLSWGFI